MVLGDSRSWAAGTHPLSFRWCNLVHDFNLDAPCKRSTLRLSEFRSRAGESRQWNEARKLVCNLS
jgi:hypothetical protein